ncbi:MAG: LysM domain-containing protein [Terriglobales bacterium]
MSNGILTDPVQAMLAQTSLQRNLFTSTSRYYGIDTETLTTVDGTTIVYLKRRFLPSPDRFQLLQEHTVTQAERLDNIAAKFLGDPELFWRIADANGAMRAEDLVQTVGRKLKITLPEGIAGASL